MHRAQELGWQPSVIANSPTVRFDQVWQVLNLRFAFQNIVYCCEQWKVLFHSLTVKEGVDLDRSQRALQFLPIKLSVFDLFDSPFLL